MRLTADDFGVVPPICVGGRDIERTNRHQRQLFAVLAAEVVEGQTHVTLDRAINLDIPSMARPRLTPTELVEGFMLTHVRLNANCPQAQGKQAQAKTAAVQRASKAVSILLQPAKFSP